MSDSSPLERKVAHASEILAELRRVLVAFSGGVDSSVLLKLAVDTLGREYALAVTAIGPLHPAWEKKQAQEIAELIGARHVFVEDPSCRQAEFLKNTAQRCYFCKKALLEQLLNLSNQQRLRAIVAGENSDDQFDYRPGFRAMQELGVRSPLKEAFISKAEVRLLAKQWNLPNFDLPSSPCLATRVAYGQPINTELLHQIEEAEDFLRIEGFKIVRVRVHGPLARIEVSPEDICRFFESGIRDRILARFKQIGFTYVSVDLAGYETGNLNKLVDTSARL